LDKFVNNYLQNYYEKNQIPEWIRMAMKCAKIDLEI